MLMTAAGTTRPAEVLVLGAGVAGLQAIATARRLGAVVTAHDVREAARADIASTGAAVLALDTPSGTGDGGYARALTDAEARAQQDALDAAIGRFDVVITTAQVPGGRPPLLVSEAALAGLRPGSVVVDLAAGPLGGNVAGSRPGRTLVTAGGVTVVGAGDLAATMPKAASTAYSRNLAALLRSLLRDGTPVVDLGDEIVAGVVVTHGSEVVHPRVRAVLDEHREVRS
jgi:NAD(P) transhydrogenase subunit alpha